MNLKASGKVLFYKFKSKVDMDSSDLRFMIDDGLFEAASFDENKTTKDFQRCISLRKQLQQSWSSCKS